MAKISFTNMSEGLQTNLTTLLERLDRTQMNAVDLLSAVKAAEGELLEKEELARKARIDRERQERLREMFASEHDHAVHVGGTDEPEPDRVAVQEAPKAAAEPEQTAPAAVAQPEPPQPAAVEPVQEPIAAEKPAPEPEPPQTAPEMTPPEKPAPQKPVQGGGYVPHSIPQQQGGYAPRPQGQTGGYAPRPQGQTGGYAPRPQGQTGGYAPRPQGQTGGYAPRPQGQTGGYAPRPQGQTGGYAPRQGQTGGYAPRQGQTGGYAPRPQGQTGGYAPRQGQQGGYAPRQGQQGGYAPRQGQAGGYAPRQGGAQTPARTAGRPGSAPAVPAASGKERVSNYDPNRSAYVRTYDNDKRNKNKKAMQRETAPDARAWDEDAPTGSRRPKRGKQPVFRPEPVIIEKAVITTEMISVKDLSEKIGKPAAQIIKKLFMLGIMATINQEIDFDTSALIASDFGIELEQRISKTFEDVLSDASDDSDAPELLTIRPPVVTIMGHVDHGKTSLLDAIRDSSVTEGEAGGITQHIGAYTVLCNARKITFIDTPGHEAFTSMRARGAQVTDIVILVVAADDGIMPQTVEAINHAKAAGVPIIVAINKMDKPEADPERVKQQLTEYGLVSEEWGGETICVPVSAKTQMNLDMLLEMILLQADVLELKANPERLAKGTIIEAKLDKGRGPIATVLVQNGTLRKGDPIVAGTAYGRVRAMMDDRGRVINEAGPSTPVEILGFSEVPDAGDTLNVTEIDKLMRQVAEERRDKIKAAQVKSMQKVSLDDLFSQMAEGDLKDLNLIVKADVQGSVEAVKQALEKLSNDEVRVKCIHGGVGAITATDIMFASASNAIVIGFNVRPDSTARTASERENVDVRTYRVIYNAIEDVQNAMKGMFKPVFKETELGRVSVRETFRVSGVGTIAGSYVQDGKITRSAQVRVVRDGVVVHEGKIASLKRFKDDVREVLTGYECGIGIEGFNDLAQGDVIEAFIVEEVKR